MLVRFTYAASSCIWFTSKHGQTQRTALVPCAFGYEDHDETQMHFAPQDTIFCDV